MRENCMSDSLSSKTRTMLLSVGVLLLPILSSSSSATVTKQRIGECPPTICNSRQIVEVINKNKSQSEKRQSPRCLAWAAQQQQPSEKLQHEVKEQEAKKRRKKIDNKNVGRLKGDHRRSLNAECSTPYAVVKPLTAAAITTSKFNTIKCDNNKNAIHTK